MRRERVPLARAAGLIAALALALGLGWSPSAAQASTNFTWDGVSSATEDWSSSENWEGGVAPASSTEIGTLTFPRLTSTACTVEEAFHPCYFSTDDLTGLSAESIQIDDGDSYLIEGEPLALGGGGIDATPFSGASGPAGDLMFMPLRLTASQKWSIANRSGGAIEENGVLLGGDITGPGSALTVEQSNGSALIFLDDNAEVGPITLETPNTNKEHIKNGAVILDEGELNSADQQAVNLRHIFFAGIGAVGALNTQNATLDIGSQTQPEGALEASSVALDSASGVIFEVTGEGATPQVDYSQLIARGSVDLNDANILLVAAPAKKGAPCPTLTPGETFTLISTSGSLSGTFAETGHEMPIEFAPACDKPAQTFSIGYSRSDGAETVTATVEAAVKLHEEEGIAKKKQEEEAAATKREEELRKLLEGHAKQAAEEVIAANKQREAEAAAAKKLQEAATTAKGGVLGVREASPPRAPIRAQLLAKALHVCGKYKSKKKRVQCRMRARKKYGSRRKGKSMKR